jgi:hypothetical protein
MARCFLDLQTGCTARFPVTDQQGLANCEAQCQAQSTQQAATLLQTLLMCARQVCTVTAANDAGGSGYCPQDRSGGQAQEDCCDECSRAAGTGPSSPFGSTCQPYTVTTNSCVAGQTDHACMACSTEAAACAADLP